MTLTDQHIAFISNNLDLYGLKNNDLKEDLLDHICTHIENSNEHDFEMAYKKAIHEFGGHLNLNHIEHQTNLQLYFNASKNRNKLLFILSYISAGCILLGIVFKFMHWPFASILLVVGFAFLIFLTLPIYFYSRYKDRIVNYQS